MLTDNISVSGRLIINASIGTVKHLDIRSKPLCSVIYVKFADPKAGNFLKHRRLLDDLEECMPIITRKKEVSFKERQM